MATKVMTGARALVYVDDELVGIFDSCSYGTNVGVEPIFLLGRYGADEITPTSYEAVNVDCSGFRVVGAGVHTLPKMPKVQDLLNLNGVVLSVRDRQSGDLIMNVIGCVPYRYGTGHQAKATTRINMSYLGLRLEEEQQGGGALEGQDESPDSSSLP